YEADKVATSCQLLRLGQVPAGEIAAARIQYLAFLDQLLHCLPDFLPRGLPIDVMHLIQVDAISLKPPQARLACPFDVQGRQARLIRPLAHPAKHFRRQNDFLTPSSALGKPAPQDLLSPPLPHFPTIDVRRVEKVEAQLQ